MDSSGSLFGVTSAGGKSTQGVLYKLAAGTWKEATLHNLCAETDCTDGRNSFGRLVMDASGNLFGMTLDGSAGASCTDNIGCGVVFERPAAGAIP